MRGLRWLLLMFLLGTAAPSAQAQGKAAWKARLIPADVRVGEQAQVVVEATIEPGWHIYSLTPISPGPRPIKLELDSSSSLKESGNPVQPPPHKKFDEGFKKEIEEFSGAVAFGIPVQITGKPGAGKAVVKVQYQACDPRMCLPPARVEVPVNFTVAGGAARPNRGQPVLTPPVQPAGYRKPDQAGGAEQTPLPNPAAAPGKTPLAAAVDAALQPPGGGDAEEDPDAPRVTWKLRLEPPDPRPGEAAQIVAEATIKKGWHIYSLTKFEPGPRPVQIELVPGEALRAEGPAVQPEPKKEFDQGFKKELEEFFGAVAFGIPVRVTAGPGEATARVKIQFQACDPRLCLPVEKLELPLQFTVVAGEVRTDRELAITTPPTQPQGYEPPGAPSSTPPAGTTATGGGSPPAQVAALPAAPTIAGSGGLLGFLWASIAAGFLALLTPCVFPMIPITVSFFSKQDAAPGSPAAEPKTDLKAAAAYCLGIIGTFTALGVGLSLVFGATGIQNLARNPWVNGLLAIVFLLLALTLFEVIHPRLPSGLIEKTQAGAGTGGVVGPILMGLTFSLTSFTCTVPFVGALLASASQGDYLQPTVGMLGFSTAFSSPFFLLALFPRYLAKLPRAGGWLTTVKVTMGFVELAAAVKFVSNIDLVYQWGLLTRPAFLAVWFTLALVTACYLAGWLRLPNEYGGERIGWLRQGFAVACFAAAMACLGGVRGNSLGTMDAFLPPRSYGQKEGTAVAGELQWELNYEKAVARARAEGKPLFLNFTGVTCTNCRLMEENMFPRKAVKEELAHFVLAELFTDKETEESARYQKLEQELYKTVALPYYAVRTADGQRILEFPGQTWNEQEFLQFLRKAREGFAQIRTGTGEAQVATAVAP